MFNNEVMGYLRQLAIGRATKRILTEAGVTRTVQAGAAARTASAVTVAGGSPGVSVTSAVPLTGEESGILGKLARGAGIDAAVLAKGYSERRRRGE